MLLRWFKVSALIFCLPAIHGTLQEIVSDDHNNGNNNEADLLSILKLYIDKYNDSPLKVRGNPLFDTPLLNTNPGNQDFSANKQLEEVDDLKVSADKKNNGFDDVNLETLATTGVPNENATNGEFNLGLQQLQLDSLNNVHEAARDDVKMNSFLRRDNLRYRPKNYNNGHNHYKLYNVRPNVDDEPFFVEKLTYDSYGSPSGKRVPINFCLSAEEKQNAKWKKPKRPSKFVEVIDDDVYDNPDPGPGWPWPDPGPDWPDPHDDIPTRKPTTKRPTTKRPTTKRPKTKRPTKKPKPKLKPPKRPRLPRLFKIG